MQVQKKALNFEGENIYVGIDVHLKNWYVSIMTEHLEHKHFRQNPDAGILYRYLQTHFPGATYYSAYEAGFCGFSVHYKLLSVGINNIVVNPSDIPTSDKEYDQKSDPVDATKLARSLRSGDLKPIYVHRNETLQDRSLLRTRSSIQKDMTRVKNRIKGMLYYYGVSYPGEFVSKSHWSNRFICWLKEDVLAGDKIAKEAFTLLLEEYEERRLRLLKITRMIRQLSRSETYAANMELLRSVPGIGLLSGMFLLVNIEDIERFPCRDNFRGYLGLKPSRHQSSDKDPKGKLTRRGQKELRGLLVESAWIAARMDPALSFKFNKLRYRMEPQKAIIQITGKLANRIFYVLKNKQKYVNAVVE